MGLVITPFGGGDPLADEGGEVGRTPEGRGLQDARGVGGGDDNDFHGSVAAQFCYYSAFILL